ncbi:hypothetical protein D3C85_1774870 [compost metagenome]|nr:conserved protein of unknown function [Pseudomonas sp. JV241A]
MLAAPWPKSKVLNLRLKTVAVGCAVGLTRTRNNTLQGFAPVASAGAVWLLISSKVQAKNLPVEGLSSLLDLCLGFSGNPKM